MIKFDYNPIFGLTNWHFPQRFEIIKFLKKYYKNKKLDSQFKHKQKFKVQHKGRPKTDKNESKMDSE